MANLVGKRYQCSKCGSELIVTRGGEGTVKCCGEPVTQKSQGEKQFMPNQLGKRFKCDVCNTEVLITKAGEGSVECDGKPMEMQQPKPLPSSD